LIDYTLCSPQDPRNRWAFAYNRKQKRTVKKVMLPRHTPIFDLLLDVDVDVVFSETNETPYRNGQGVVFGW
jgi:hypothetical protein